MVENLLSELSAKGYWPAVAMDYFNEKKYSMAVELCMMRLKDYPDVLSGRVVLACALYHSGQYESAGEQFYEILRQDPNNLVALKYLGDLKFRIGDEATAFSYYSRVLEIEPLTGGLSSPIEKESSEETKILTLKKGAEKEELGFIRLRSLPLKTETVGDLLLAQKHPRLAMQVFREVFDRTGEPRLKEKLEKTQKLLRNRETKDVSETN